jgi:hypothetical protein
LIQKIHCQDSAWTTTPPTSGPASTPMPITPLNTPSALARCSGPNAALTRAMASGIIIAPPAPCATLAAISRPTSGASAHATDATVNNASPARNTRRLPSRSPSAAPVIIRTA